MRRVWIEIHQAETPQHLFQSPSMRRVWIEMSFQKSKQDLNIVTLHAEGVD